MTTSSDSRSPSAPRPDNRHWQELIEALPASVASLDAWFDRELVKFEQKHEKYITRRSLRQNLRG
ncbi:hypothetical protein [Candidatus Laterigemmans baculatus]|uniref:hypothetical protein n=1 Tax=Candidatus Laterigemmans baculatus TaxID=2770505 RepID=UPI0013DD8028|nr:hypothetical protein [Candidatus Laterigemmans baculatus]